MPPLLRSVGQESRKASYFSMAVDNNRKSHKVCYLVGLFLSSLIIKPSLKQTQPFLCYIDNFRKDHQLLRTSNKKLRFSNDNSLFQRWAGKTHPEASCNNTGLPCLQGAMWAASSLMTRLLEQGKGHSPLAMNCKKLPFQCSFHQAFCHSNE